LYKPVRNKESVFLKCEYNVVVSVKLNKIKTTVSKSLESLVWQKSVVSF